MSEEYLLDTHIWLWSLIDPKRLSASVQRILANENSHLYLSSISVWEAILLGEKKRVHMIPDADSWVRENLSRSPVQEAAINHEIALQSRTLKIALKDPADRFIVATAKVYHLRLISADAEIHKCKDIRVLEA